MKVLLALLLVLATGIAQAATVTFSWLPNSEPDLAGYRIYWGGASGQYSDHVDVGLPPIKDGRVYWTMDIPDDTHFFAATAYDTFGQESEPSNELRVDPAPKAPDDFSGSPVVISNQ